jgi:hypothetical protein
MSQADLGRILRVSRAAVHAYLDGDTLPGRATAAAIEKLTGIPVYAWDGSVPIVTHPTGCGCADCRRGID